MNNYELLKLYPHNIDTCKKVKKAFDNGNDIVSIIKATGTGKSYVGLNVTLENNNQKIIWLVPTNAIKEHIEEIINNNLASNIKTKFDNLEIRTYSSLVSLSEEELEDIFCDLLILDEFHHIGAPVWGEKVNTLISSHPNIKVFGMSAYNVRDRGTSYERDMTNPETEEIFSNTVVDKYDLYDAIIDGVLPLPITKTALIEDSSIFETLRDALKVQKLTKKEIQHEIEVTLDAVLKTIHKQNPIKEIIQETIQENGKYIYFCPVSSLEGINDIETIKEQVISYIEEKFPNKKIIAYQSTSDMGVLGNQNRNCFYQDVDLDGNDVSNTIRIMFAKNQYNEGVHAPNIDGVFLGRKTKSDIVALEQIGRALSVRENINIKEKYRLLEIDKLKELAKNKGIIFDDNVTKEYLIELLIAPIIIDLTGNIEFIEELETKLKYRIKERKKQKRIRKERLQFLETHSPFMLEIKKKELLIGLLNLKKQVQRNSWDDYYDLLVIYYNYYGNVELSQNFKTKDGITFAEDGVCLGAWCNTQRVMQNNLSHEKVQKLKAVNFRFENKLELEWQAKYNLALKYYKHYGNSEIPQKFKTKNGYKYDEDGVLLGPWVHTQRIRKKYLSQERIEKLKAINFRFEKKTKNLVWNDYYKLVEAFYKYYGHSDIPKSFETIDGITSSTDKDAIKLGDWCERQRSRKEMLSIERKNKLDKIYFRFENKRDIDWQKMYDLSKIYYEHYGNSEVPSKFKAKNGYVYDEDGFHLGGWHEKQRRAFKNQSLSEDRKTKLDKIEFRFKSRKEASTEKIELCQSYNINFNKYKILDRMSYQELYAKIMFLLDSNLSLETDGKLHPIFTMCNANMIAIYKISKEELIDYYYINRKVRNHNVFK